MLRTVRLVKGHGTKEVQDRDGVSFVHIHICTGGEHAMEYTDIKL